MEILRHDYAQHDDPQRSYARQMDDTVMPYLRSVETSGVLHSFDGAPLRWYAFRPAAPRRTVVMLHGFTESARKYAEMIWYFVNAGCSVYIMDQRGHGMSHRPVEDGTLTHVDRFEDYVRDLECLMEQVVPDTLPLELYAHSMGGAVAALYLERHPDVFDGAVLSSPMIAPQRGGYPLLVSQWICRLFILLGKGKERIFLSQPYPGEESFEDSCSTSRERFAYYEAYRRVTPTHQNYSPTYRWTLESLRVTAAILKKGMPERVRTRVLLCSADGDSVVIPAAQRQFAARLQNCRLQVYHAKHEIFNSTDAVMADYVNDVLEHLT